MRLAARRHRLPLAPARAAVPVLALVLTACGGASDTGSAEAGDTDSTDTSSTGTSGTGTSGTDTSGSGDPASASTGSDGDTSPAGVVVGVRPEDVTFEPSPLVAGATGATVVGDPTGEGLYVLLGEIDEGVVFPTHTHPDDRITTVVTGTMYYSTDEQFDRDEAVAYPAGSVIYTPAGTPHTMWARDGDIVVQEAGDGPTGLELVEQDA